MLIRLIFQFMQFAIVQNSDTLGFLKINKTQNSDSIRILQFSEMTVKTWFKQFNIVDSLSLKIHANQYDIYHKRSLNTETEIQKYSQLKTNFNLSHLELYFYTADSNCIVFSETQKNRFKLEKKSNGYDAIIHRTKWRIYFDNYGIKQADYTGIIRYSLHRINYIDKK